MAHTHCKLNNFLKMKKFISTNSKPYEFLIPYELNAIINLVGLKSGNIYKEGIVVYTGKDLTPNDILEKMIEAGLKIRFAESQIEIIKSFLDSVSRIKIGRKVEIKLNQLSEK